MGETSSKYCFVFQEATFKFKPLRKNVEPGIVTHIELLQLPHGIRRCSLIIILPPFSLLYQQTGVTSMCPLSDMSSST